MRFPGLRVRQAGLAAVAVLSLLWTWSAGVLAQQMADPTRLAAAFGLTETESTAGMVPSAADVPDDVLQSVARAVASAGDVEELVVLPDPEGGYHVSATIQLGYGGVPAGSMLEDIVAQGAEEFFSGLYTSGLDVTHAEVYWLAGGELVAGAGLGAKAYERLASQAGGGGQTLWRAVSAQPTVAGVADGDECWAEIRAGIAGSG